MPQGELTKTRTPFRGRLVVSRDPNGFGRTVWFGATFCMDMNVIAWILGIVLAGGFGIAGVTKVLDLDRMREHLGYSKRQYQLIGASEITAAAGLVIGVAWAKYEWVGHAAAVGIGGLMLGAIIAHARVEDEGRKIIPAIAMLVLATAYIIVVALR